MNKRHWFLGLSVGYCCIAGNAFADDEESEGENKREDPFAYERTKAAERRERDGDSSSGERSFGYEGDVVLSAERVARVAQTRRRIDMPKPTKDIDESVTR